MAATTVPGRDERLAETPLLRRLMSRPELGAVAGTILVFLFFAVAARGTGMFSAQGIVTFLEVSAQLGIIAVAAALLMIGGEFDLSIGSMIAFAGLVFGALIVVGDLNTSPWSPHFRDLLTATGLRNAAAGHGWIPTWPTWFWPALIPIDHVLVRGPLGVEDLERGPDVGSDHYPLIAGLRLAADR